MSRRVPVQKPSGWLDVMMVVGIRWLLGSCIAHLHEGERNRRQAARMAWEASAVVTLTDRRVAHGLVPVSTFRMA